MRDSRHQGTFATHSRPASGRQLGAEPLRCGASGPRFAPVRALLGDSSVAGRFV